MGLPAGERRILGQVEQAIQVSDPQLTSMFTIFSRLNRDEQMPAGERLQPGPLPRRTAWSLYAFAVLVFLFTIVMTARSGAASCAGAARANAAGHHAQTGTCALADGPALPGAR